MDMNGRTTTRTTVPAIGPMDMNSGRPQWAELAPLFGLLLVAVLPMGVGGALIIAVWPQFEWTPWNALGAFVGGAVVFASGSFFWTLRGAVVRSISSYYQRLDDYHTANLEALSIQPVVELEEVSEWSLRSDDPRHLLLFAIGIYWQTTRRNQAAPWSVTNAKRVELHSDRGTTLLGETTEQQARQLADLLSRAGVITGRSERKAGQLAVADADELLERVIPLLRRV